MIKKKIDLRQNMGKTIRKLNNTIRSEQASKAKLKQENQRLQKVVVEALDWLQEGFSASKNEITSLWFEQAIKTVKKSRLKK
jgi:hypothetical protein